jgi:hypothetical protein
MPRVPSTRYLFLVAAALAAATPARTVHAGIILAVGDPQNNGVMVFDGPLQAFAPAADSPAHASAGNGRSSVKLLGSQMAFSFEVSGSALASTGPNIYFGAIPILIEGTAGEPSGSPVILQLQSAGNVPQSPGNTDLFIGLTLYSANQTYNFTNFKIGDEVDFWGGLQSDGNGDYTMTVTLSVLAAPSPAVPEPSSLLLMSAGLVLLAATRFYGRRAAL